MNIKNASGGYATVGSCEKPTVTVKLSIAMLPQRPDKD